MIGGTTLNLEAIRGDTVPSDPRSSLVIVEIDNQFSEFTSSVIVQVEEELLIFIGTTNGLLLKVVTNNVYNIAFMIYVSYSIFLLTKTSVIQ